MARFTKKTFSHRDVSFSISNLRNRSFPIYHNSEIVAIIVANVKKGSNLYDDADLQFKYGLNAELNASIMEVFIEFLNTFDLSVGFISQKIKSGSYRHYIPENINKEYFVCSKENCKEFDFHRSKTFICKRKQIDLIRDNGVDIYFPATIRSSFIASDENFHGHVFGSGFRNCSRAISFVAYSPNDLKNLTIDLNLDENTCINIYKRYKSDEALIFPKFNIVQGTDINNIHVMFFTEANQRQERIYPVDFKNINAKTLIGKVSPLILDGDAEQ